jgi:2-oxoglutarate ferredoxin oxidoreductase subunit gamma
MIEKTICAGFGGQGVMSMGRLIAYTAMYRGLEVSWLPSYGPEMRGGTANCHVVVSETLIGSPVISRDATCVIAMNLPSMQKFEIELVSGGLLLINSSLIEQAPNRTDIRVVRVPANEIASAVGTLKSANMVMLGAFLKLTGLLELEDVMVALKKVFGPSKEHFIPMNEAALRRGMDSADRAVTTGAVQ